MINNEEITVNVLEEDIIHVKGDEEIFDVGTQIIPVTAENDPIFTQSPAYGIASTDISNWNGKSDFSGNYNDLTNKPSIPTNADFTLNGLGEKNYNNLTNKPTNVSTFTNDAGYLTQHQDISGKVDKVTGKGLSTNDYTTTEKNKLSGIATSAQVNVIETIKRNGTALSVSSKSVDITVPTKTTQLTNDSGFITSASIVDNLTTTDATKSLSANMGKVLNEKSNYSTTEQVVGSWVNGKPVYRRTIIGNTPAATGWSNVAEVGNNLTIIKMEGVLGGYLPVPVFIDNSYKVALQYSNGYIQCNATGYNNVYLQVTIEYTKSTD